MVNNGEIISPSHASQPHIDGSSVIPPYSADSHLTNTAVHLMVADSDGKDYLALSTLLASNNLHIETKTFRAQLMTKLVYTEDYV